MVTQGMLGILALLLAGLVWSGHVRYWHVAVMAVLVGVANTMDNPARQSFVMDMVGKEDVANAVALNSAAFNAARIVGPAVAGVLIARVGVAAAFLLNGASFLFVLVALGRVGVAGAPRPRGPTTMTVEIREGLAYALRTPRIRLILAILLVVSLSVFNISIYVPLLARNVLGQGAEGFGLLMASVGVGAVSGALTLGTLGGRPRPRMLFASAVVACAALLGLGFVRQVRVAAPVLFALGFAGIMTVAGCNTALQLAAPDAMRGRLISLHQLIFGGSFPFGALAVGAISERWGVSTAFLTNGAAGLIALGLILLGWPRPGRRHARETGPR
jgi:predicted MFS family arabinose efflux permease